MQLILVRHPAPDIAPGLCYGRLDVGLSPAGLATLATMRTTLAAAGISKVVTSPARRCLLLAQAITPAPIIDPRLQELDFGAWEGVSWDAVPRAALDAWAADPLAFAPPGGETGASLIERVGRAVASLVAAGDDCIVITHGGPLRLLPALLRGQPPDLLAPAPPIGAMLHVTHDIAVSPAHSAATAQAPNTSPVNPPI
ncbi:MAG: histidine phosphatase family protein [Janthinobacterium lividum]